MIINGTSVCSARFDSFKGIDVTSTCGGMIADGRYTNTAMRVYHMPDKRTLFLRPKYGAHGTHYGHSLPLFMPGCDEAIKAQQLSDGYAFHARFLREGRLYYSSPKGEYSLAGPYWQPSALRRSMRKALNRGTLSVTTILFRWFSYAKRF